MDIQGPTTAAKLILLLVSHRAQKRLTTSLAKGSLRITIHYPSVLGIKENDPNRKWYY